MYQSKATIVVLVLMLVFAGQASATPSFKRCFSRCIPNCASPTDHAECLRTCLMVCVAHERHDPEGEGCYVYCAVNHCVKFGDGMYHLINTSILYIHMFLLLSIP